MATLLLLLTLLFYVAYAADVNINAGGPSLACASFRADTGAYVSPSNSFVSPRPMGGSGGWLQVYQSHRWAPTGDLVITVPVPAGSYGVALMFMETWTGASAGVRQFSVSINGEPVTQQGLTGSLDVFARVGLDKPFYLNTGTRQSVNGQIVITLGRIAGKNNPMVSGVRILGEAADTLVGNEGVGVCGSDTTTPTPTPTSSPSPASTDVETCQGGVTTTDLKSFHLAHSVAGGPYVETDFNKDGVATVALDGLRSHSHFSEGTEIGEIVLYRWTWTVNGVEQTALGAKQTQSFPVGVTDLKLFVQDQKCNTAEETTTVTINTATSPGAYCYYYDLGESAPATVPLPPSLQSDPKPEFATNVGDINFQNTASFDSVPFNQNSFAVRCTFSIEVETPASISYKLVHNGPVKIYNDNQLVAESDSSALNSMTETPAKQFSAGLHQWQILYVRPATVPAQLLFQFANGGVIPASTVRHDAGSTLPVITSVTKASGQPGEFISVFGSAFVNNVMVKFGTEMAEPVESSAGAIQMRIPPGTPQTTVEITVKTEAGVSNSVPFTYGNVVECEVVMFQEESLKNAAGATLQIPDIAVLKYGPDGRLYLGSQRSEVLVLALNQDLEVQQTCTKNVQGNGPRRYILGIAFNPMTTNLKMYFTTNTFNWKKFNLITDFAAGWTNGKVQSVTLNSPTSCFNDDVADVITGLPVSNHDHGNNFLQFLPTGELLIGIGGFTNGGVTVPDDALGGIPPSVYTGVILSCPESGANIVYSDPLNPDASTASGGCSIYAPGLRNTFASELHTNGFLYATDNGPNQGFGDFSTDCNGGSTAAKNSPDKLFKVVKGQCHGHPNSVRAVNDPAQCIRDDPRCVAPLLSNLQSSTNGVIEYRSNFFAGELKENLLLAKFSDTAGKPGRLTRVVLNENGDLATNGLTNIFHDDSGLSIVEGPRGEIIMSRVFKQSFFVLKPVCPKPAALTYFMGVHPRRGPATGGHRVTISGFNFGNTPSAAFGASPCTDVQVISDDAFSCVTPPGVANMQVKVIVQGSAGENIPTTGTDYWYW